MDCNIGYKYIIRFKSSKNKGISQEFAAIESTPDLDFFRRKARELGFDLIEVEKHVITTEQYIV